MNRFQIWNSWTLRYKVEAILEILFTPASKLIFFIIGIIAAVCLFIYAVVTTVYEGIAEYPERKKHGKKRRKKHSRQ